jgi:hypothetical protein
MTVDELEIRLGEWARYIAGGSHSRYLGLPGHCTYLEYAIKSTSGESTVPDRVWDTDKKVRALGAIDMELRTVIEMAYLGAGVSNQRASAMGYSKATYFRRLEEAMQMLIGLYAA